MATHLSVVPAHVAEARRKIGLRRHGHAHDREVVVAQEGLGVGLRARVDALVEEPEEELPAVEKARVGVARGDERMHDVLGDRLARLGAVGGWWMEDGGGEGGGGGAEGCRVVQRST